MNISYDRIAELNKKIKYTDVRGKNYAEVTQRVQAFRNLIPDGYITTDILKMDSGIVFMKAEVGYYAEDGRRVMLSTGLAFERQDASRINNTSFIENCETSAIGRALGFIGLGSESSIASAEELQNAIATQEAIENGTISAELPTQEAPATVSTVPEIPPVNNHPVQNPPANTPPVNPVLTYLSAEREELRKARKITAQENTAIWNKQIAVLRANNKIPQKALSSYTQKEAEELVNYMYTLFTEKGTELMNVDGQTA